MISAAMAIVAGGTYAAGLWDKDSVVGNVLGISNINPIDVVIDRDGVFGEDNNDDKTNGLPVEINNMIPGFESNSRYFAVANNGSLPFDWKLSVNRTNNVLGTNNVDLGDEILYDVWIAGLSNEYTYGEGFNCQNNSLYSGQPTVSGNVKNWERESREIENLAAGKAACIKFVFKLPNDLGGNVDDNFYLGTSSTYTIEANATQIQ